MSAPELTMTRSILFTLNVANFSSIAALSAAGSAFGGAAGRSGALERTGRRPEELVLNPELCGSRAGALLPRRPAVQHVDDFAAVVEKRLEDRLDRGDIRGLRRHRRRHPATAARS